MKFLSFSVILLTGCSLQAPKQAPDLGIPANFKETAQWKGARPAAHLPKGEWWKIYKDHDLSAILTQVNVSNANLAAAAARYREAAALLLSANLAFAPTLTANGSSIRSKNSNSSSTRSNDSIRTINSVEASSSWEIDLWGRLRHEARATTATVEAAASDVESTRLSLQAQAAQTYFFLRSAEAQHDLITRQISSYEKSLEITRNRYAQGVVSRGDVAQAESQLASAKSAAIETKIQRATLEHALATLTGKAPAAFSLSHGALSASVPAIPSSTPSRLLERRPDIAAAERRVAAANERIGAAKAAFFPTLTLGASGGWSGIANLLTVPTTVWSLGPQLAAPILDGGQRLAAKAQADAAYDETVALYRQTVLTALQETEDALATLRLLAAEAETQNAAVKAARENERITLNEYKAGTVNYLNVAVAQANALNSERSALDVQARRLNATAALVTALGGAW